MATKVKKLITMAAAALVEALLGALQKLVPFGRYAFPANEYFYNHYGVSFVIVSIATGAITSGIYVMFGLQRTLVALGGVLVAGGLLIALVFSKSVSADVYLYVAYGYFVGWAILIAWGVCRLVETFWPDIKATVGKQIREAGASKGGDKGSTT